MTAQPLAVPTKDQRSFAFGALFTAWRFPLALVLICAGAGLVSVILGPDNYWDLRFYHLYGPWAYLHDRYLYDIGPAQEEGFLNPVADFLLYGLISSPLNGMPRLVAFIMGAVHGINAAIVFAIACHVIRPSGMPERWTLRSAAFLMGVSGAGFISLLGTCSNDLTTSLFILGSVLSLLKVDDGEEEYKPWLGFTAAGLSAGIGIGLKYTSGMFIPGLGILGVWVALRRKTIGGLMAFVISAGVGGLLVSGHHMLIMWNDFQNPFFPYFNQIFHSPWFESEAIVEDRFQVHGLEQLIEFPFRWAKLASYVVVEPLFRDWRGATAYVAMAVGVIAYAASRLRKDDSEASAPTHGLGLVFVFVAVSYISWALASGYYRYVIPLEMLTGVVTMGALVWVFRDPRLRVIGAALVLTMAAATTVYPEWGRRPYGDKYVDVRVPPLPDDSIVLLATGEPVSYFIPFANPKAKYVGIENNYLRLSQHNKLAAEVKDVMRIQGRPKFLLNVDELDRDKWNDLLKQFGLQLSASPCEPIRSNLPPHALSLCPLTER
ncbi:MAG TPA: hypothetical protein VH684_01375 [Xanthobacteraceae bacterium]|jgi:hypothetical protein